VTEGIVAELQGQAPLEGLAVRDSRLGFDAGEPAFRLPAADFRVPRSKVALKRKRHLGSPAQAWMKARPESLEQDQLRAISDRVPGRIGANAQIQPDDRAPRAHVDDPDAIQLAMFEAPELGVDSSGRSGRLAQAQPRRDPGLAMLLAEPSKRISGPASASISWSFSRSHRAEGCNARLHRRLTGRPAWIGCVLLRDEEQRATGRSELGPTIGASCSLLRQQEQRATGRSELGPTIGASCSLLRQQEQPATERSESGPTTGPSRSLLRHEEHVYGDHRGDRTRGTR
jgi:hypothetical protein